MLQRDLRQAVPSALGATISFDLDAPSGIPKEIDLVERTLDPDEIAAGLRIPLTLPQQSLTGSILFYAGEPGDRSPPLPAEQVSPSVVHVTDLSLVNDALGVLINRGHSLTEARAQLHDRASRARTGLPDAARTLLDGLPTRRRPRAVRLLTALVPAVRSRTGSPRSGEPRRPD